MSIPFPYRPSGGGHNCTSCGVWVPASTFHTCNGNGAPAPAPVTAPVRYYTDPDITEIVKELKRIADTLEKMRKGGKSWL